MTGGLYGFTDDSPGGAFFVKGSTPVNPSGPAFAWSGTGPGSMLTSHPEVTGNYPAANPALKTMVDSLNAFYSGSKPAATGAGASTARRNPVLESILSGAAREASNLARSPLSRTVVATTRNPAQAQRISGLSQQVQNNQAVKNQSIADFTKEMIANKPKNRAALEQEQAAVDRVYATGPGSLQDELAQNARQQRAAVRSAAQRAVGVAGRDRNVAQIMGGVNSSYLNRAYGDQLSRIMTDAALRGSALDRENILYTQAQRNGLLGTRGRLADNYLDSILSPYERLASIDRADAGLLGAVGGLEDANTIYDSFTPEQNIERRLRLAQMLQENPMLSEYGMPMSAGPGVPARYSPFL